MEHVDALSRTQALRSEQAFKAKLSVANEGGIPIREALAACGVEYGVPPRLADTVKGDFAASARDKTVLGNLLDVDPISGYGDWDGAFIKADSINNAGRFAAAVYNGFVARGLSAKWVGFSELAVKFTDRVSMSANSHEWDNGAMADWQHELDSMRYCYDLVVIHGLSARPATDFVIRELHSLLTIRLDRTRPTLVTIRRGDTDLFAALGPDVRAMFEEQYLAHTVES